MANSSWRLPAKTRCVCGSTSPGVANFSPASITRACSLSTDRSTSSLSPHETICPSLTAIAASFIRRTAAREFPRAGPWSTCGVTNSLIGEISRSTLVFVVLVLIGNPPGRSRADYISFATSQYINVSLNCAQFLQSGTQGKEILGDYRIFHLALADALAIVAW